MEGRGELDAVGLRKKQRKRGPALGAAGGIRRVGRRGLARGHAVCATGWRERVNVDGTGRCPCWLAGRCWLERGGHTPQAARSLGVRRTHSPPRPSARPEKAISQLARTLHCPGPGRIWTLGLLRSSSVQSPGSRANRERMNWT